MFQVKSIKGGKEDKYFDVALLLNAVKEFKKCIHWFDQDNMYLQRVMKADEKAVISSTQNKHQLFVS